MKTNNHADARADTRATRAAFTLIELTIVLAIIAIITSLAASEAWRWRGARLGETALQNLAEIKEAVIGEGGYLDDLGRLPDNARDLSQLWRPPDDAADFYAVRPATATNLASHAASPADAAADADPAISIPCGWRGPYLRLALGKDSLLDAWGNKMEAPDDAGYTARLIRAPGGGAIIGVRHLGADGAPDAILPPQDEHDKEAELYFHNHLDAASLTNATLTLTLAAHDAAGNPDPAAAMTVTARVYGPDNGKIAVSKATGTLVAGTLVLEINSLTPGARTLRIEYGAGKKTPPRQIKIRPGANAASERVFSY